MVFFQHDRPIFAYLTRCCHVGVTTAPMETYLQKNFYKTGSLMANACRAAAMLENKDRTTCDAAFQYGRHVGLASAARVKVNFV